MLAGTHVREFFGSNLKQIKNNGKAMQPQKLRKPDPDCLRASIKRLPSIEDARKITDAAFSASNQRIMAAVSTWSPFSHSGHCAP